MEKGKSSLWALKATLLTMLCIGVLVGIIALFALYV